MLIFNYLLKGKYINYFLQISKIKRLFVKNCVKNIKLAQRPHLSVNNSMFKRLL